MNYFLGILFTEGAHWKEQRRFTLSALRDFGMGKLSLEGKILEEVESLLQEIRQKDGAAFKASDLLNYSVANVICNIVFGNRFEYTDKRYMDMAQKLNQIIIDGQVCL